MKYANVLGEIRLSGYADVDEISGKIVNIQASDERVSKE